MKDCYCYLGLHFILLDDSSQSYILKLRDRPAHFYCMLAIQLSASWNSADFSVLLAGYRIKSVLLRPRLSFRDHLFPVVAGNSRVFSLFEGSLGRN
jgi:hypothetical protein